MVLGLMLVGAFALGVGVTFGVIVGLKKLIEHRKMIECYKLWAEYFTPWLIDGGLGFEKFQDKMDGVPNPYRHTALVRALHLVELALSKGDPEAKSRESELREAMDWMRHMIRVAR